MHQKQQTEPAAALHLLSFQLSEVGGHHIRPRGTGGTSKTWKAAAQKGKASFPKAQLIQSHLDGIAGGSLGAFPDPRSSQYLQTLTTASPHPSATGSQAGSHRELPHSSPRPPVLHLETRAATPQHRSLRVTTLQPPVKMRKGPRLFLHGDVKHFIHPFFPSLGEKGNKCFAFLSSRSRKAGS